MKDEFLESLNRVWSAYNFFNLKQRMFQLLKSIGDINAPKPNAGSQFMPSGFFNPHFLDKDYRFGNNSYVILILEKLDSESITLNDFFEYLIAIEQNEIPSQENTPSTKNLHVLVNFLINKISEEPEFKDELKNDINKLKKLQEMKVDNVADYVARVHL